MPFRYYFCQREAVETLIYLYEVCGLTSLSALTAEFTSAPGEDGQPGEAARRASLGIHPDEDQWARYAFKLATGAGIFGRNWKRQRRSRERTSRWLRCSKHS